MYVVSLRSSGLSDMKSCAQKYYIGYVMNRKSKAGVAASCGTILHKNLEWLANIKLCWQNNTTFFEDDDFGRIEVDKNPDPHAMLDLIYDHHVIADDHVTFTNKERKNVHSWLDMVLESPHNPLNLNILHAELKFEFEIKKPWAKYHYILDDGTVLKGYLKLHGTVDLVTIDEYGNKNISDYKTGSCINWSDFRPKTYEDFLKDQQILFYQYALRQLFQDESTVFSIIYIRDGGCTTLPFTQEDYEFTEKMIQRNFETIRNTVRPQLKIGKQCGFCYYGKTIDETTGLSICETVKDQVAILGVDKTAQQFGDISQLGVYGTGGGRKAKE